MFFKLISNRLNNESCKWINTYSIWLFDIEFNNNMELLMLLVLSIAFCEWNISMEICRCYFMNSWLVHIPLCGETFLQNQNFIFTEFLISLRFHGFIIIPWSFSNSFQMQIKKKIKPMNIEQIFNRIFFPYYLLVDNSK